MKTFVTIIQMHRIFPVLKSSFYMVFTGILLCSANTSSASEPLFSFAVIADHKGHHHGLDCALNFIHSQRVGFIFVPGDYYPLEAAYRGYYSKYGYCVDSMTGRKDQGVYFILGNHDKPPQGDQYFQSNIAPYYPHNGPDQAPIGTVFSFDKKNCHFVITNQYWHYPAGGYNVGQLRWMQQDLAKSRQPFKFVFGHEPAFPTANHVGNSLDSNAFRRDEFWTILKNDEVQAFFCGHTHHLSVLDKNGVCQIDVGEVYDNHASLAILKIYPNEALVHLFETEKTHKNIDADVNFNQKEVFRMRIKTSERLEVLGQPDSVLFDSSIVPSQKAAVARRSF